MKVAQDTMFFELTKHYAYALIHFHLTDRATRASLENFLSFRVKPSPLRRDRRAGVVNRNPKEREVMHELSFVFFNDK